MWRLSRPVPDPTRKPEFGPRLLVAILLFVIFMAFQLVMMWQEMTSERNTTGHHWVRLRQPQ